MEQQFTFKIKTSIVSRTKKLVLDKDFIEFDNIFVTDPPIRILKSDISGIKYGFKWISGYQFTIGIVFCIDVKSADDEIIRIKLKTVYGINKNAIGQKYSQIINSLFDLYFDDMIRTYLSEISAGKTIEVAGVSINQNGVSLKKNGFIPWEELGTRAYQEYYLLNSKNDRNKHKAFFYIDEWNTGILYSVTRSVLKEKGLWNE